MMNPITFCAVLGVTLTAFGADRATDRRVTPIDPETRAFLIEATRSGLMDIEMGRLAQVFALNPGVKDLGRSLVIDHERINRELALVARRHGYLLPRSIRLNPEQRRALARLQARRHTE